jgi:two-component system sensor histidine kinase ChvG
LPHWRLFRSLAAKGILLALIVLAVPVIVYDRFRDADETRRALLLRSVQDQGRLIAIALEPLIASSDHPSLPQLGRELARFADAVTNVKLLFAPIEGGGFYYIASAPVVETSQLEIEREKLRQEGVLDRLAATCDGALPFALRYRTPGGSEEIVTSVTPMRAPSGCWAVLTSFPAEAIPGSRLGRPYWQSPEVEVAAGIYLAMVLLIGTTLWSIRRGLRRFTARARAIREHRPGGSFGTQNDMPELAIVAKEFDEMVEVLANSARDMRRAAEDNAHAFKTPIAVIRQSLEPLKRAIEPGNRRGLSALVLIERSLDRLDGLVASARRFDESTADLMDMPRSMVDLSRIVGRLMRAQGRLLVGRNLTLEANVEPQVFVNAHEEMLETVVENLFENAVSFTPDGGTIDVSLAERGAVAELVVSDSGPGVPPDNLDRIFERYFSHRPPQQEAGEDATHFGIGLWITRRNVEALGGTIRAENREPGGLAMRVILPLARGGRALPPPANITTPYQRGGARVP